MLIKNRKKALTYMLICSMTLLQFNKKAQAVSIRETDVETAANGNELLGVSGKFENVAKDDILNRVNEIRKEACQNGYINPSTGMKLSEDDYVEIKWSSGLELIAQLRAAESTIYESHERPNGERCFSISYNNTRSWAENLAWNHSGMLQGIEQWYGEKEDWVKQNTNTVTGHYESLINPKYKYIGTGSFIRTSGGWYGISAELSTEEGLDESKSDLSGEKIQIIEVQKNHIGKTKIQVPAKIKAGSKKKLNVVKKVTFSGIMGGTNITNGIVLKEITWSSSKKSVASVSADGTLNAKKAGKTTITAKIKDGKSIKTTITIQK
ncbi:MAG: CAP domain-containing protein [Lachnospiraceae bacterium]|jgi:Uncharacterized protein with SCP/PR1 domains